MGTKNNPGAFDCFANAEPDEPMFILLGRDPVAGLVVELWAWLRVEMGKENDDDPMILEAKACAKALREWAVVNRSKGDQERAAFEALLKRIKPLEEWQSRPAPEETSVLVEVARWVNEGDNDMTPLGRAFVHYERTRGLR